MKAKATAIICILATLLIFSLQNSRPIRVRFFFWGFEANTLILIAGLFAAGFIVGMLAGLWKRGQ